VISNGTPDSNKEKKQELEKSENLTIEFSFFQFSLQKTSTINEYNMEKINRAK
jgi:hypothetical protein